MNTQQLKPIATVATSDGRGVAPLTPRAKTQWVRLVRMMVGLETPMVAKVILWLSKHMRRIAYRLEYRGENKWSEGKETCMPAVTRVSYKSYGQGGPSGVKKVMQIEIENQQHLDGIRNSLFEKSQILRNEGDRYEDKKHEDEDSGGNRNTSLAKAFRGRADDFQRWHDAIPAVFKP